MKYPTYNPVELEPEMLQLWNQNNILKKLRERNKDGQKFYFLEGPPYTSGKIHLGTAWNMVLKDMVLRYKRMQGFNVWDRMGYDMHGLPTEQKVMKKFDLKNKGDIEKYGLKKFTDECEKFCKEMMLTMNDEFIRIGATLDFSNPYQPISNSFMEAEWWLIKEAHKKGRLYQGLRTMHWDSATQSSVAKHELEYKQLRDTSVYMKFQSTDNPLKYFMIWTTTPWTIPLNLAIMVNPNLDYVEVQVGEETWVLAESLVEKVLEKAEKENFTITRKFKGEELGGLSYNHPLNTKELLPKELQENPKLFTILLTKKYVDDSAGTGLVHSAPGCGPEDYEVGHENGVPPFNCVNEEGFFENFGKFTDLKAKTDDNKFIGMFGDSIIAKESYVHDYPHGERSHEPVIFRTTKQWFFKVEDLKDKMLAANEEVYWNPEAGKNAFRNWLENLRDNSITKQRYWGTPVPIWSCGEDHIIIGSIKELEELSGQKIENMHIPDIDSVTITKDGKTYKRVPDVLDVWIDAGTVSWNCLDYPNNKKIFNDLFPADFILEGKDQIRGWFNLLMVASFLGFDKPAFKNVFMHGFVTDVSGVKMSKSIGNVISPNELLEKHGADTLRFYMCQTNAGEDINFSWDECVVTQRQLNILWNIHKLLINLAREHKVNPFQLEPTNLQNEENYIISRLNTTINKVTEFLDAYKLNEAILPLKELFLDLSRTYVQMTRDKSSIGTGEEKKTVIYTIGKVLLETIKMFNIISPFICEAIYQNLKDEFGLKEESISHYSWPSPNSEQINRTLEAEMNIAQDIIASILHAREKAKLSVRWPVKEIIITTDKEEVKKVISSLQTIIKTQTNVKEIKIQHSLEGVKELVSANRSTIGSTFGPDSPLVLQEIEKQGSVLLASDKHIFTVGDKKLTITKNHLKISRTIPELYVDAPCRQFNLYLNQERTPELDAEGFTREVMRQVQSSRKNAGLHKQDRIKIWIKTNEKLKSYLSQFKQDIKDKVGADELLISIDNPTAEYQNESSFKVKGEELTAFFSQVL